MKLRLLLLSLLISSWSFSSQAGDVALIESMKGLQYFTHKTTLAVNAKNPQLARFYAHELEEILEELESVSSYHGQPIAKLVKTLLLPSFEALETTLKQQQWQGSSDALDTMINSCNQCHQATQHGFIQIQRHDSNPYFQKF